MKTTEESFLAMDTKLALAQEILRVRQDWREPRGVIRPARSR